MEALFTIGATLSLALLIYGAYLSISYSLTSATAGRRIDDVETGQATNDVVSEAKIVNLASASNDRRTDFTIGFHHPSTRIRKAA